MLAGRALQPNAEAMCCSCIEQRECQLIEKVGHADGVNGCEGPEATFIAGVQREHADTESDASAIEDADSQRPRAKEGKNEPYEITARGA